jgi:hypothetical protein
MSNAKQTLTFPTQVVGLWEIEGRALGRDVMSLVGYAVGDSVGLAEGATVGTIVDGVDDGADVLHAILGTNSSISEDNSAKSVTSATCPSLLSPAM